ncbi:hypothetical protein CEXT_309561 [Caerostris extrusa]|uniref:Uncharacterized protein n=1 Tax=Caerostris extrusa TaxID=172846 RepID=A0AAV4NFI2_CAEEX|nr:hypothetical protein CEXT_309561 [Caerostris extrusa]
MLKGKEGNKSALTPRDEWGSAAGATLENPLDGFTDMDSNQMGFTDTFLSVAVIQCDTLSCVKRHIDLKQISPRRKCPERWIMV